MPLVAQSIITNLVYALEVRPFRLFLIAFSPTMRDPNAMTIICPGILLRHQNRSVEALSGATQSRRGIRRA